MLRQGPKELIMTSASAPACSSAIAISWIFGCGLSFMNTGTIDRCLGRPERIDDGRNIVADVVRGKLKSIGVRLHQGSQFTDLIGRISQANNDRQSGSFG